MNWWHVRKGRKVLRKVGYSDEDIRNLEDGLKQGYKEAKALRDELRKQESPRYKQLIVTLNQITKGTASLEMKKKVSIQLVENAELSEYERNDLLEQLESIYNANR